MDAERWQGNITKPHVSVRALALWIVAGPVRRADLWHFFRLSLQRLQHPHRVAAANTSAHASGVGVDDVDDSFSVFDYWSRGLHLRKPGYLRKHIAELRAEGSAGNRGAKSLGGRADLEHAAGGAAVPEFAFSFDFWLTMLLAQHGVLYTRSMPCARNRHVLGRPAKGRKS